MSQTFRAMIIQTGKTACGIEVPAAVVEALGGSKRPAVTVTLDHDTYRSTVAPMSGGFWVGVNSSTRGVGPQGRRRGAGDPRTGYRAA